MDLVLTEREAKAIKIWADSVIHGGHWGDGDAIIPEEDIIIRKLNHIEGDVISLNEQEARIILSWSDSTLGIHTLEEESVLKKLKLLLDL
jgi:hypothetical protein